MRKWINLFEDITEITVPSFVDHITDDLVDEVLQSGKWVEHGSDLDDTWEQGSFEGIINDVPDDFWNRSYDDVRHTPEFRECVRTALHNMATQAYEEITQGNTYDSLPPLTPETVLYRGLVGEFDPARPLGIFWSVSKAQAAGRFAFDGNNNSGYVLTTTARQVQINWEGTIRSRLDYGNGADEAEIQLIRGSSVKARLYRVVFKNESRPVLTFIREFTASA